MKKFKTYEIEQYIEEEYPNWSFFIKAENRKQARKIAETIIGREYPFESYSITIREIKKLDDLVFLT